MMEDQINFCFLSPKEIGQDSLLPEIHIETEIGDKNRHGND